MTERIGATSAGRRRLVVAFVGFFLALTAWSFAAPYNGMPDEQDHVLRAAGVVTGQVFLAPTDARNGGGAFVTVPNSLVRDMCWQFEPKQSAACAAEPGGDATPVWVGTTAGRYHPLYYAIVGAPLAISPDWTGVLLARMISAALCAALLAFALTDALAWSRHRLMAVGVLVAFTPMVAHMGGAINPSGLELAAGIAFFAAAVPLLFAPSGQRSTALLSHAGGAAIALASLRFLGPLWLFLALLALLVPPHREKLRRLWAWPLLRRWAIGVGAAVLVSLAWTVVFKGADANPYFIDTEQLSVAQAAWKEVQRWPSYISEMVGVTSWLDAKMPELAYVIWPVLAGAVVIWGYLVADRAGRLRFGALAFAGFVVPFAMSVWSANTFGFITQGRYLLPVLVGFPILAAFLLPDLGLAANKSRTLLRAYAVLLLPIHVVSLVFTMIRWQQGVHEGGGAGALNPLNGSWHPVVGSVIPLVLNLGGLAAIGWLVWTSVSDRAADGDRATATAPPAERVATS